MSTRLTHLLGKLKHLIVKSACDGVRWVDPCQLGREPRHRAAIDAAQQHRGNGAGGCAGERAKANNQSDDDGSWGGARWIGLRRMLR